MDRIIEPDEEFYALNFEDVLVGNTVRFANVLNEYRPGTLALGSHEQLLGENTPTEAQTWFFLPSR